MPAQSPTLSPTLSAMTAGLRGSSSGMPASTFADQVGADVGALGEDAAAETGEDRDQRGAEGQADQRLDDVVQVSPVANRRLEEGVVAGHPSRPRPTTSMPVIAPPLKATASAGAMPPRGFGRPHVGATETFMPMKPAAREGPRRPEAEGGQPTQFGNQANDEEE